jgi:hypothetical protein
MPERSWKGKGEAVPRRSPRKRGKTCGRPFKAPRQVQETIQEIITVTETETNDSQVQVITETNDSQVNFVPETEKQDVSDDSDDNVPMASLLGPKTLIGSLTFQQIKDCKEGPQGDKAVGVTVAKIFDGVEFKGLVDSFRTERKRYIYHVTYTDGDEEELAQKELRDAYVLGLAPDIEAQWNKFNETRKDKNDEDIEGDTSDGEGSMYDKSSEEEEIKKNAKRRRRNKPQQSEIPMKRKKPVELSGLILPQSGDKTVAGEAFQKLSAKQKQIVADKINKKTKKVTI